MWGEQSGVYDMLIPQEELKEAMETVVPDRKFVFNEEDVICQEISKVLDKYDIHYVKIKGVVVAENLIQYIYPKLDKCIKDRGYKNLKIVSLELSSVRGDYSTILTDLEEN